MTSNWLGQSILSMLLLIPIWIAIGFFERNFQLRSEVFLIWYFLGVVIASIFFTGGPSLNTLMPSWKIVSVVLLIGLTVGAGANILLFRAVAGAPNPGLPLAIANAASIGVFCVSILLSRWLPSYFNSVKTDLLSFFGIVLTVVGISLIAIRR